MQADVQAKIEEVVAFAKANPGVVLTKEAAIERFVPLYGATEQWTQLHRVLDEEWGPDKAELMEHCFEEDRLEELREGAEPTAEELSEWQEEIWSLMVYADIVFVYRGQGTDGTKFSYLLTMDGMHQGSTHLDGAGPFLDLSALTAYVAGIVKEWFGWHTIGDDPEDLEGFRVEVERLSGKVRNEDR